jgi:polyribonucleotide nucleotidyltransferase
LIETLRKGGSKQQRNLALENLFRRIIQEQAHEDLEQQGQIKTILEVLLYEEVRRMLKEEKRRIDGRDPFTIRPISGEVGWLPRTHGSALFTRGETQAMVTCTLGTGEDEQVVETLEGEERERFLLHYNFPPYSVGEIRPIRGPGRCEIGHGELARRALQPVLPDHEQFPYTIRIVSDISESNGSSSMATVCGGCLALMDAGVPIASPVAGIAMGLIKEGDDTIVLSDILGDEDHLGDMDFKIAGTRKGVTALQLDNKLGELPSDVLSKALEQAKQGRLHILDEMANILAVPRETLSPYAPRISRLQIRKERIRDLIGPGGKIIQEVQRETNTRIQVEDDGTVRIYSANQSNLDEATRLVNYYTAELEVGKIYRGVVVSVKEFGAFVRIYSSLEGLVHISELEPYRVNRVSDIVKEGDEIIVKVLDVDSQGKIKLSRKAALNVPVTEIQN